MLLLYYAFCESELVQLGKLVADKWEWACKIIPFSRLSGFYYGHHYTHFSGMGYNEAPEGQVKINICYWTPCIARCFLIRMDIPSGPIALDYLTPMTSVTSVDVKSCGVFVMFGNADLITSISQCLFCMNASLLRAC